MLRVNKDMKTVYVAHPYGRRKGLSSEFRIINVWEAIKIGRNLILKGFCPVIPLLYHYVHRGWKDTLPEEEWMQLCLAQLRGCDMMLAIRWTESKGVQAEIKEAEGLQIPVFYSLEDLYADSSSAGKP